MNFIKHFERAGGSKPHRIGSAIFIDGKLIIRLPNTKKVIECGYVKDGFGVLTEDTPARKSPYTIIQVAISKDDLPPELCGQTYKYRIYAKQISENEFVFPFANASIMNKK